MFAVVFEVHPAHGEQDHYLGLAKHLKPLLEKTDGFLSNERFESRRRNGWMLSVSMWRDEKSVVRWRTQGEHHAIQLQGRDGVFSDYHLRVGEVTADNDPEADVKQQRFDETETGEAKALGLTEVPPRADEAPLESDAAALAKRIGLDVGDAALVDYDAFESIYNPGKMLLLTSWKTADDADRWTPAAAGTALHHQRIRSIRDYGMFDRREAFQFCPLRRREP